MAMREQVKEAWGWYRNRQAQLLDVRSWQEFQTHGCLPEAAHIPLEELQGRVEELEHFRPVVVFDCGESRSQQAVDLLKQHGFRQVLCAGDYQSLQASRPLSW